MVNPPISLELTQRSEIPAKEIFLIDSATYLVIDQDNSAWIQQPFGTKIKVISLAE